MGKTRVFIALAAMLCLMACGEPEDLTGDWRQIGGSAPQSTLSLRADGTGAFKIHGGVGYPISSWAVAGDSLNLVVSGDTISVSYELEGNNLRLSGFDGYEQMDGSYRR